MKAPNVTNLDYLNDRSIIRLMVQLADQEKGGNRYDRC